jgi:hypothetical protein
VQAPNLSAVPQWVIVVGILITWAGFAINVTKHRSDLKRMKDDEEDRRRDRDDEQEKLVYRVCREFTNSMEYRSSGDQRIREIAMSEIDDAFNRRSPSFISAERYEAERRALDQRLANVEQSIRENTREMGALGGQITTAVTSQLTHFLTTKVFAGKLPKE